MNSQSAASTAWVLALLLEAALVGGLWRLQLPPLPEPARVAPVMLRLVAPPRAQRPSSPLPKPLLKSAIHPVIARPAPPRVAAGHRAPAAPVKAVAAPVWDRPASLLAGPAAASPAPAARRAPEPWDSPGALMSGEGARTQVDAPVAPARSWTGSRGLAEGVDIPSWLSVLGSLGGRSIHWPADCPRPTKPPEAEVDLRMRFWIEVGPDGVVRELVGPGRWAGVTAALKDCLLDAPLLSPQSEGAVVRLPFEIHLGG